MKKKLIGVLNHKGGVGKTFIASHLIWGLNQFYGKKVLGIDTDSQCDLLRWMGGNSWTGNDVSFNGVKIMRYRKNFVRQADFNKYDYIIWDSRPAIEDLAEMIKNFDMVLIPIDGRLSVDSALDVKYLINELGIVNNVYIIRNKIVDVRPALRRREELLVTGLNSEIIQGGIIYSELVRASEYYRMPVWRIKAYGVHLSGITPFFKMLCEKVIYG